jgi:hypothetical protein
MTIIYTNSRKKLTQKQQSRAKQVFEKHQLEFCQKLGQNVEQLKVKQKFSPIQTYSLTYRGKNEKRISVDSGTGIAAKRSIMDPMVLQREKPEVVEAIKQKAMRTAPLFNKGGLQYISDGEDLTSIGKKVVG